MLTAKQFPYIEFLPNFAKNPKISLKHKEYFTSTEYVLGLIRKDQELQ
jgi:hypothetical protein